MDAIPLLLRATQLNGDDPRHWCNLGVALSKAGFPDDSQAAMMTAANILDDTDRCALDADDGRLVGCVGVGIADKDPERSLKFEQLAVELAPDDAYTQGSYGLGLLNRGLAEDALPHLQGALDLEPEDSDYAAYLLRGYIDCDMFFEAMDLGEASMKKWPNISDIRFNLALVYLDHGQEQRSTELFADYLREFPDNAHAHGLAGVGYAFIGWDREARQEQEAARRLAGGEPSVDQLVSEIDEIIDSDDGGVQEQDVGKNVLGMMLLAMAQRAARQRGSVT